MVTTTWNGGSSDWNTASNWTAGVPTAADDAVIPFVDATSSGSTISGSGPAASLLLTGSGVVFTGDDLTGTHAVGSLVVTSTELALGPAAALTFQAALFSAVDGTRVGTGSMLFLDAGASTGTGTITLDYATVYGTLGVLANPIVLSRAGLPASDTDADRIDATGTLAGVISGAAALALDAGSSIGASLVLANPANSYSGGLDVRGGLVVVAATGATGSGPVVVEAGTLALSTGVTCAPITAGTRDGAAVSTVDASLTVFAGANNVAFANGSGNSTFVGATGLGRSQTGGGEHFGQAEVTGGTGRVTVFAGNGGGSYFGGTSGGNVIVAGQDLSGFIAPGPVGDPTYYVSTNGSDAVHVFGGVTIGGGGDGDLLVASGTQGNIVAAGAGNETLTGSGASGANEFFGGTGADLIVAGSGHDLVVCGSGAATVVGGGGTTIFAGDGPDLILGGAGGEYVQVGSGSATVFAGAGAELLSVVAGQAGGSVLAAGFRVGTDHIAARGLGIAPTQTVVGGNTVLGFADHTQITLLGVASLPASAFV